MPGSRRVVQVLAAVALNLGAWLQLKWLCPQVFWCHSCPLSVLACPIGVISHYASFLLLPVFALGVLLLVAALVGRLLCGWACPFGFIQDLLFRLPGRKLKLPEWTGLGKYVVLAVMVLAVPVTLGLDSALFYCRTCPVATLNAVIPGAIQTGALKTDAMTLLRLAFLGFVLLACVASSRAFCRVLCPIAALVAPLNELAAARVRHHRAACVDCGVCRRACPMGLEPMTLTGAPDSRLATRTECISCNECVAICPRHALKLSV